jgi:N-methylhydantoinase B/oxoprolinase/acetone carboxylase alpha subunit
VLTSQRIVDVVLKAFHAAAASQGCTKYARISCIHPFLL